VVQPVDNVLRSIFTADRNNGMEFKPYCWLSYNQMLYGAGL